MAAVPSGARAVSAATSPHVEPEWAMATVAFVDIRGFTTFADRAGAREAADYLNEFFAVAIPVVVAHGGHVNQLLGDGLLAVFGAPVRVPDHADRALAAATEMLRAMDGTMGDRCRIGIGINTGLVLVGTMGAAGVRHLAVVGDPVNVAARVQDATRDLGEPLLLTEATRMLLDDPGAPLEARGALTLRGKAAPVPVHGLVAAARNGFRTPAP
jgi:adenylate cyclase